MISATELNRYLYEAIDLRSVLGIPTDTELPLTPIGQGEYNANFRFTHPTTGNDLVLRVNTGSQMHLADQIGYEFKALRLLESSGRTPHAYYVDGSCLHLPYGLLVMDFLPGRPLAYETDLPLAAQILADVHSVPAPANCHLVCPNDLGHAIIEESRELLDSYATSSYTDPDTLSILERLFRQTVRLTTKRPDSADGRPGTHDLSAHNMVAMRHVISTELNSANFLINGPGHPNYLIDWEKPILGEVEQDLAHFLSPTTTLWKTETLLTRAQMTEFLDLYRTAVDDRFATAALESRFDRYLSLTCLRALTWCAMAYAEYQTSERPLRNEYTYRKIKMYLEPDFLENIENEYFKSLEISNET